MGAASDEEVVGQIELDLAAQMLKGIDRLEKSPLNEHEFFMYRETITQAYCHMAAGACLALAMRFASTHNQQAYDIIVSF